MRFILVGAGGAVGSLLRYGVALWFGASRFPWGTLTVNLVGSFALGLLMAYALGLWPTAIVAGLAVGLVGGFTTFSTFAWEALTMTQAGGIGRAAIYLAVSVAGGLLAALLGLATGRALG